MENTKDRIDKFINELKELEKKHGFEIDHHGEFVSYLIDKTVSNNRDVIVCTLFGESLAEDYER